MPYLQRQSKAPATTDLTPDEISFIERHFEITPQTVTLNGITFPWAEVTEIEVAKAARQKSPAGWFVKNIVYAGGERHHLAIYAGRAEAVLPNTTLKIVQFILHTIAYYAPKKIQFTAPEGIAPVTEE